MTRTLWHYARRRFTLAIEFKAADLWIGCYWRKITGTAVDDGIEAWVCIVPMLPLHIWIGSRR